MTACGEVAAIGPTLVLDVQIEGEPVEAMVDSGSHRMDHGGLVGKENHYHCLKRYLV